MKIDLVLTGGTIGSKTDENGILDTVSSGTAVNLINNFYKKNKFYEGSVDFRISNPLDLISENLNLSHWNVLINHLKSRVSKDVDGIIITHGTDTLAFTSNLLSLLFYGIDIPVFIVSSSMPLSDSRANGYDNFTEAVMSIIKGVTPSVYVPYKNKNQEMFMHHANLLTQSFDFSSDLVSAHPKLNDISKLLEKLNTDEPILHRINSLKGNILIIDPYPGLRYSDFDLTHIDAVLHRTYHSFTANAGKDNDKEKDCSIFTLKDMCNQNGIPLYFSPIISDPLKTYSSTDSMIQGGLIPIYDMTYEMSYIYLLVNQSL